MPGTKPTADLSGWSCSSFTAAGLTHPVYRKGSGPGVVLIPEIPGVTPEVLALGEHLVARDFSVAIPSLFGTPGRPVSVGYALGVVPRLCVASEFRAFATNAERPVAQFLRGLAADLAATTPGPGVGVIVMCFTGGFALATAVDDSVLASVLSQPAVPFPVGAGRQRDPGVSEPEMATVEQRAERGDLRLVSLRFSEDKGCRRERLEVLKGRLGDAMEVIELDSSPGNPDGYAKGAHSVLTTEVRENPDNSAARARDRIVAFLTERLLAPSGER